jgi:hypothetical protein
VVHLEVDLLYARGEVLLRFAQTVATDALKPSETSLRSPDLPARVRLQMSRWCPA